MQAVDENVAVDEVVAPDKSEKMQAAFEEAYERAEAIVKDDSRLTLAHIDDQLAEKVSALADLKSAGRGIALTLLGYRFVDNNQDIRSHKSEFEDGFSARSFDTRVTIPFLISKNLPRNVESHWLTQTFSFAPKYEAHVVLKTVPKRVGPLFIEVINSLYDADLDVVRDALAIVFERLIRIRNADKVVLTRPKDLPIHSVRELISNHISKSYQSNGPRLPQLVIYAAYQSLVKHIGRYEGSQLEALERLKAADRKRGTIADIVVQKNKVRVEAVEIKHDQPIQLIHVLEAIDKVRAESVTRYYLLSNKGIDPADKDKIRDVSDKFLKQNGCEIIANGLVESLNYYLRLLPDTKEFLFNYAELLESDADTGYEHRNYWNELCQTL